VIATVSISTAELSDIVSSPYADEFVASGTDAVILADGGSLDAARLGSLPFVVIGVRRDPTATVDGADVVVDHDDPLLDAVLASIERHPIASTSLAVLLRSSQSRSVEDGLAAESAVYSLLQAGPEFAQWRAQRRQHSGPSIETGPAVLSHRDDGTLVVELNRPQRHNAFSRSMRDGLTEILGLAVVDDSIRRITVTGRGPSFCSGGDLAEFGSFDDPATAHRTRLTRSPARSMHRLADRTTVHLHGNCIGAGIELPAFAGRVIARPDTVIALPEIELGLIPGAGGTVSLPRRIGRQRTALLALSGARITAATALAWGLVDEIG
jgi:enoyl-CoA hydratase